MCAPSGECTKNIIYFNKNSLSKSKLILTEKIITCNMLLSFHNINSILMRMTFFSGEICIKIMMSSSGSNQAQKGRLVDA